MMKSIQSRFLCYDGKTIYRLLLLGLMTLLAACGSEPQPVNIPPPVPLSRYQDRGEYVVDTGYNSVSRSERSGSIHFLVLHYTATSESAALTALTQKTVSAHYLILDPPLTNNNKPVALALVPESEQAWHAGKSYWRGYQDLNDTSIGIEIVNPGFTRSGSEKNWYSYSRQQIDLIVKVTKDLVQRYNLSPQNVVAHSDIAPLRKSDPGPMFPWKQLAEQGIGAWPDEYLVARYISGRNKYAPVDVGAIQLLLSRYGYDIKQTGRLDKLTRQIISAFQMHFRPNNFNGNPDVETEAIALALLDKYPS